MPWTPGCSIRVPDADRRRAFARTGLTITGCEQAAAAIEALLRDRPELLASDAEAELRAWLLEAAMEVEEMVRSCATHRVTAAAVPTLAAAWIAGADLETLRAAHADALGVTDTIRFSSVLDGVVARDLPWVLSSLLELLGWRMGEGWEPSAGLAALPAMAKFGLPTPSACFAASIGIRARAAARQLGTLYDRTGGPQTVGAFLAWVNSVEPGALEGLDEATVRLLLDRAAGLGSPRAGLSLLARGAGVLRAPLRGMGHAGRWWRVARLPVGAPVVLDRERANPHDPNAILVRDQTGGELGYVAREVARNVAPLLDLGDVVEELEVRARLVRRTGTDPARPGTAVVALSIASRS